MTILQAILLGLVQGLTEFIPVSSTAHLVFAARLVDLYGGVDKTLQAEQTTATIAVIQLGTLLAVLIYFSRDIVNITRAFVGDHLALLRGRRSGPSKLSHDAWLGWLVIIGSIPVGTIGLLLKKQIEGPFTKNLWVIATMMILVGLLLTLAEFVGKRDHGMTQLGVGDALAVGFAQVLALIPGSSRSGSTIMAGLFAGQTRETAARFSFLLSIPAVAAERDDTDTPPTVVLPPEPPERGYEFLPISTFTPSSGRPKVSATTILIAVRFPTPRSWEPIFVRTEPSWLMVTSHSEG